MAWAFVVWGFRHRLLCVSSWGASGFGLSRQVGLECYPFLCLTGLFCPLLGVMLHRWTLSLLLLMCHHLLGYPA